MKFVPFILVIGLSGASASISPVFGGATVLLIAAFVVLIHTRIDAAELLVMTMPLTFYVSLSERVNISVSDLFLVLLIMRALIDPSLREVLNRHRSIAAYIWILAALLFSVMTIGVIAGSSAAQAVAWQAFLLDAFKLLIVLVYLSVCFVSFTDKFAKGNIRFLAIWSFTALGVALLGIVGALLYDRGIDLGLTLSFRAQGTFEDPNAYASYLIASAGIVMVWNYIRKHRVLSWHLIPIAVGAYLAYSRAASLTVGVVLLVGLVLSMGDRVMRPLRWVVYLVATVGMVAIGTGALGSLLEPRRELAVGGDIRFSLWSAAIRVWEASPIFGVGLGQFRVATSGYVESSISLVAHNTYLSFLAEGGLLGVVLFLAIPGACINFLLRTRDTVSKLLLMGVTTFIVMAATLNLQNFRPMWVFLSVATAWCMSTPSVRRSLVERGLEGHELNEPSTWLDGPLSGPARSPG